jgi:hypothetical protein
MNPNPRRTFLLQAAGTLAAMPALAQSPAKVDEKDPTAMALGFSADTTKVDAKKYPAHTNEQRCGMCMLYAGKAGEPTGPCSLFAGKLVTPTSWCSAFAKKA